MARAYQTILAVPGCTFIAVALAANCVMLGWSAPALAADSKRLTAELEALDAKKKSFEEIYSSQTQKLEQAFDDLVVLAEGSKQIATLDRQAIVTDLKAARKEFANRGNFAKIPAMQSHYVSFVVTILASYQVLMQQYQRAMNALPKADSRHEQFTKEMEQITARVAQFDSMKKGSVFTGVRQDFNWGPVKGFVEGEDAIRLKRIKNGTVEAEIRLKVTERQGSRFAGRLHQGGFAADVEGTYDGVNLNIRTVRKLKGAPRYFEYSGQLVGQLGILDLVGVKTNGVGTTGKVILERQ